MVRSLLFVARVTRTLQFRWTNPVMPTFMFWGLLTIKTKKIFLTSWILFMSFAKILSGTQLECPTFWMQTRNDFQLVLILVLTVCKVISRRHCLSDKMLYTVTRVFLHISVQWHRSLFYNIKCKLYLKFKYNTIEPERSFSINFLSSADFFLK